MLRLMPVGSFQIRKAFFTCLVLFQLLITLALGNVTALVIVKGTTIRYNSHSILVEIMEMVTNMARKNGCIATTSGLNDGDR